MRRGASTAVVAPGGGMSPPGAFTREEYGARQRRDGAHVAVENGHHDVVELLLAAARGRPTRWKGRRPRARRPVPPPGDRAHARARADARPRRARPHRRLVGAVCGGGRWVRFVTELLALGAAVDIATTTARRRSHALVRGHASTAKLPWPPAPTPRSGRAAAARCTRPRRSLGRQAREDGAHDARRRPRRRLADGREGPHAARPGGRAR